MIESLNACCENNIYFISENINGKLARKVSGGISERKSFKIGHTKLKLYGM